MPDLLHIMRASGLPEVGSSHELRARLRDHMETCVSVFREAEVF